MEKRIMELTELLLPMPLRRTHKSNGRHVSNVIVKV